jgi:hypothetical protein
MSQLDRLAETLRENMLELVIRCTPCVHFVRKDGWWEALYSTGVLVCRCPSTIDGHLFKVGYPRIDVLSIVEEENRLRSLLHAIADLI